MVIKPEDAHQVSDEKEVSMDEEESQYGYRKDFQTALPQFVAVSVKNLLLLSYGMTLGFPTILIPAVENPKGEETLRLEKTELSWISSINLMVVPLGCALSGVLTSPIGRRRAMQVVNGPFLVAWLLFHFSTSTGHLYGALFLTGLAGGLLEAPVLTYVAEITQPHLRGALSATSSMSIILGVFTQFFFGLFLYWRTVAVVNIFFTVLALVALCFVPESPHWLVSKNRHDVAKKSLQWLRGWTTPEAVEQELKDIQALYTTEKNVSVNTEESFAEKVSYYLEMSFFYPFFLICLSFFIGHFSGMTTLQTYAVSIFQKLQAPIDKYYATLLLGILQIVGAALCVLLVHFTGKRPLTFLSTAGSAFCCIGVAIFDYYNRTHEDVTNVSTMGSLNETLTLVANATETLQNDTASNQNSWIPTTLLMLLALLTHTGIRLLPWILIGEVLSAKTRSGGAGLASAVGYIFGFLSNKMYINMVDQLAIWGTYGLYGVISLIGCCTFYFILPETEGKTLNDIQNHFSGGRKLTNTVYRSKKRHDISKMQDIKGSTNPSFEPDSIRI